MISKRIKFISSLINKDDSVLDIGTDHALLPIYLIKNGVMEIIAENYYKYGKFIDYNKEKDEFVVNDMHVSGTNPKRFKYNEATSSYEYDSSFNNNSVAKNGGAIYSQGSSLKLTNCSFEDCYADSCGGAINNHGSNLTIDSCSVNKCHSYYNGGAINGFD